MSPPLLSVLLGAESLIGARSGVGRMALQIALALRHDPRVEQLRLLFGPRARSADMLDTLGDSGAVRPHGRAEWLRARLRRIEGLLALHEAVLRRRLAADIAALRASARMPLLYHEPNMIARPFDGPTVVTINDLSWRRDPAFHPAERVAWIERGLPRSLAQATRVVAISGFTRDEIVATLGVPHDHIDVVPLAASPEFGPSTAEAAARVLAPLGLTDRAYVLSVSTREPRKNFDGLLRAHRALPATLRADHPLVIAGGAGWGSTLDDAVAREAIASGELHLLGRVPDADLPLLYARAAAFAFVSHYEGFGLPVIEAMASGTPVIASSTTAVGETAGDAAALVDPASDASIAEGLRCVLEDRTEAARLSAAGLSRAAEYTWGRTIDRLFTSWRRALQPS